MSVKAVEKKLPPLYKRHVHRPRLTKLLDASKAQAILLIAPAGYGKTTLAAEWLQGTDKGLWYRATSASADVAAFSADLVRLVQPLFPGAGDRVLQRLRVPEIPERLARILADLLAEDIRAWPKDKWLVLDDYHVMAESSAVEEFVDWLLTLTSLQVVITSRRRPSWATARRVLKEDLLEVDQMQLSMTRPEAGFVIRGSGVQAGERLLDQVSGWPVAVNLAAAGGLDAKRRRGLPDSLYRYLAEELLRQESAEAQQTLLRCSVLPLLSRGYTGALGLSQNELSHILERQVLVDRSAQSDPALHPLLRQFLRQELLERDPEEFETCVRQALAYSVDQCAWTEAYELAQGIDGKAAIDVLVRAAPQLLAEGRLETLKKWLTDSEHMLFEHPEALLVQAEVLIRLERLAEAHAAAAEAGDLAASDPALLARAWALRGQASYWQAHDSQALGELSRSVRVKDNSATNADAHWYAFLAAQSLERADAAAHLDALDLLTRTSRNPSDRLRLAVGRVVNRSRAGSLAGCAEILQRASSGLSRESDPLVTSSFLAHWAYVLISQTEYDQARALAGKAASSARTLQLTLPLQACLGYEALANLGLRRFRNVERALPELAYLASRVRDPHPALVTSIVALKTDLALGKKPRGGFELPDFFDACQESARDEFLALLALAAAVTREGVLAESLLSDLANSHAVETILYASFARLVLAEQAEQDCAPGLEAAILESSRRRCLDAFVIAYRAWPRLLDYAPSRRSRAYRIVAQVLRAAHDVKLAASADIRIGGEDVVRSLLTPREIEVLGLLAQGASNSDIAQALVISPSTVKVHIHHIKKKLRVTNRLQAIRRYEEAGLARADES